jgi:hypothetical protein
MLRASLLADARILPQARQGSYFFNRVGRSLPIMVTTGAGQLRCNRWSEGTQTGGQVECNFAMELISFYVV